MRKVLVCLLVVTLTSASTVSVADPSLMLYVSKPLGWSSRQHSEPLAFGLRLQQEAPMRLDLRTQRSVLVRAPLLDLRYTLDGRRVMQGAGIVMFDSGSSATPIESFEEYPGLLYLGVALGVLALACATSFGICESGSSSDEYTGPGTGG